MPEPTSLFHSLRFRLITSILSIEILMLSLLVWNNMRIIHDTHTDRLRDTATSLIQQITTTAGNYMVAVDYASLENYLHNILLNKELSYIIISDRDQRDVIALGRQPPVTHPGQDSHPAQVDDGRYDIVRDITVAGQPMGRVWMGFSLAAMEDAIRKSRNRGISIAAVEIFLTILVTVVMALGLTRRLGLLSRAAAEVQAGNYSVSIATDSADEVGKTITAFNNMVAEVSRRTRQLVQEKKRSQQLLRENRLLIQKSLEVQEAERKHLSRELHDELGQCLTAIQADARSIRDLSSRYDRRIGVSADAILDVSRHIYDVVHSMMHRLRPVVLDNLGLVEALKEEIHAWRKRNPGIDCQLRFRGDLSELDDHTNITLYRIVQECLTNIVKHAAAGRVDIFLDKDERSLHLRICDDGVGMDSRRPQDHPGLGLIGIRERIEALKGEFSCAPSIDDGLCISARIPCSVEGSGR